MQNHVLKLEKEVQSANFFKQPIRIDLHVDDVDLKLLLNNMQN